VTVTFETYHQKMRCLCQTLPLACLVAGGEELRAACVKAAEALRRATNADAMALIRSVHAYLWGNGCRRIELLLGVGVVLETETSPGGAPGWTAVDTGAADRFSNWMPSAEAAAGVAAASGVRQWSQGRRPGATPAGEAHGPLRQLVTHPQPAAARMVPGVPLVA